MRALTTEPAWDQYIARPIVIRVRARVVERGREPDR